MDTKYNILKKSKLMFALIALYISIAVLSGSYVQNYIQQKNINDAQTHVHGISKALSKQIITETSALQRIQKQWENANKDNNKTFVTKNLINELLFNKALQKIILTNNDGRVTWEENIPTAHHKSIDEILFVSRTHAVSDQASSTNITLSPALKTSENAVFFLSSVPLTYNGNYDGQLIGVLRLDTLIKSVLENTMNDAFDIKFLSNNTTVFEKTYDKNNDAHTRKLKNVIFNSTINVLNQTWTVQLTPSSHTKMKNIFWLFVFIICAGLVVPAAFLTVSTFLTRLKKEKSHRKAIEKNLHKAIQNIEEMNHKASHDLRGPLASSLGLINIIRQTCQNGKTDVALNGVNRAEQSLEKLLHLVDDINRSSRYPNI